MATGIVGVDGTKNWQDLLKDPSARLERGFEANVTKFTREFQTPAWLLVHSASLVLLNEDRIAAGGWRLGPWNRFAECIVRHGPPESGFAHLTESGIRPSDAKPRIVTNRLEEWRDTISTRLDAGQPRNQ